MNARTWVMAAGLLLAGCSQQQAMQPQLDSIRVKIKQSALMAANAACAGSERDMLVKAAAVMNRRAMGGPEMAKIHKMMGMQPGESGGIQKKPEPGMSPEMQRHMLLHDAGEAVFDLLEAISMHKVTCEQAAVIHLAADAAMLREAGGGESAGTLRKLDVRISARLTSAHLPGAVKSLTLALQKI